MSALPGALLYMIPVFICMKAFHRNNSSSSIVTLPTAIKITISTHTTETSTATVAKAIPIIVAILVLRCHDYDHYFCFSTTISTMLILL